LCKVTYLRLGVFFAACVDPAGHGDGGVGAFAGLELGVEGRLGRHGQKDQGGRIGGRGLVRIDEFHPHVGPEHARCPLWTSASGRVVGASTGDGEVSRTVIPISARSVKVGVYPGNPDTRYSDAEAGGPLGPPARWLEG